MNSLPERSLLDRRLLIVTGKGGTGKTTISAALALVAAKKGRRVALVEMGRDEHLPGLIAPGTGNVGYRGRELRPGLTVQHVQPFEALAEYLELIIGMRTLVEMTLNNRAFRQLLTGAPGWRELITLGKIWHIEQMRTASGQPTFDIIIVDAPASGHGLTFLDVPRVTRTAIRAGPLRRNASAVEEMIRDPKRTLLLPVSLAEELPVQETAELIARVNEEIEAPMERVIVNAIATAPFPADLEDVPARLAALEDQPPIGALPAASVLARCCSARLERHRLNQHYLGEITKRTALPVVAVPSLSRGIRGPDDLLEIGELLIQSETQEDARSTEAGEASA